MSDVLHSDLRQEAQTSELKSRSAGYADNIDMRAHDEQLSLQ